MFTTHYIVVLPHTDTKAPGTHWIPGASCTITTSILEIFYNTHIRPSHAGSHLMKKSIPKVAAKQKAIIIPRVRPSIPNVCRRLRRTVCFSPGRGMYAGILLPWMSYFFT